MPGTEIRSRVASVSDSDAIDTAPRDTTCTPTNAGACVVPTAQSASTPRSSFALGAVTTRGTEPVCEPLVAAVLRGFVEPDSCAMPIASAATVASAAAATSTPTPTTRRIDLVSSHRGRRWSVLTKCFRPGPICRVGWENFGNSHGRAHVHERAAGAHGKRVAVHRRPAPTLRITKSRAVVGSGCDAQRLRCRVFPRSALRAHGNLYRRDSFDNLPASKAPSGEPCRLRARYRVVSRRHRYSVPARLGTTHR